MILQIPVCRDNFSYIVVDEKCSEAAVVDPGCDASRTIPILDQKGWKLLFIIHTHNHGDHTGESPLLKRETGCTILGPGGENGLLEDRCELHVGTVPLSIIHTPGHTPDSICILVDKMEIITGDTLFIGNCGRTDLEGGSDEAMFASLQRLKGLPDETIIYPGHDYGERPYDTMGNQKKLNPVLRARTMEEFLSVP